MSVLKCCHGTRPHASIFLRKCGSTLLLQDHTTKPFTTAENVAWGVASAAADSEAKLLITISSRQLVPALISKYRSQWVAIDGVCLEDSEGVYIQLFLCLVSHQPLPLTGGKEVAGVSFGADN
jgi:hypothetical protein